MLVADGFWGSARADFLIEPATGIEALRLTGEGHTPLTEAGFEDLVIERGEVTNAPDSDGVEVGLHNFADARNLTDFERGEVAGFGARQNP